MEGLCLVLVTQLFLSSAASASPTSDDQVPAQLSLVGAEEIFLTRGLDLLIAQYGAEGAEGDLRAAGAHPNPGLDLGVVYTPPLSHGVLYYLGPPGTSTGSTAAFSLWGFNLGITDNAAIEDILSGKRSLRIEAASKALAGARLNIADVKRLELAQLRQAYTAAVMGRLNVAAAKESFDTYDKQLTLNQKRYDEGAIGGLDLSRARQAQLEALQALDQAEAGAKQAMASLLFLLGVRTMPPEVTLTSGIGYATPARLQKVSLESLHALGLENRTDAKIAVANLEQAEVLVRQAKRARLPNISLSLGYSEQCSQASCSSTSPESSESSF